MERVFYEHLRPYSPSSLPTLNGRVVTGKDPVHPETPGSSLYKGGCVCIREEFVVDESRYMFHGTSRDVATYHNRLPLLLSIVTVSLLPSVEGSSGFVSLREDRCRRSSKEGSDVLSMPICRGVYGD